MGYPEGTDGELPDAEEGDDREMSADTDRSRGECSGDTETQADGENRTLRAREEENQEEIRRKSRGRFDLRHLVILELFV